MLPKQFLPLVTGRTLLQDTALRAKEACGGTTPIVVCNEAHRFLVNDQLAEIGVAARVLLEPAGRGTAAAVAIAALSAESAGKSEEPILLVLASDHAIQGTDAFNAAVRRAANVAASGMLVTFGIAATRPESGFGYIERGDPLPGSAGAFKIARFVEKPTEDQARAMIAAGSVYWNSGMFAFGAGRVLKELGRYRPDILDAARAAVATAADDLGFLRLGKEAFLACPAEAI
ncbi:MAG: mannose-1-phosphate guanylyltransferase/mannose-6-phosphate isomerase, partial [Betaproteobacteria bacterium]|nr:mannose-1-phosphate guanylyltransferase/mannose-6-phosphate isomerase [Betaproteobacteria bacterium]